MTLVAVIADYVALRQAMGYRFTTGKYRLAAFGRAVGPDRELQEVDRDRVLAFLGPPVTSDWRHKYSALTCFYRYAISRGHVGTSPLPTSVPKLPSRFVPYIYTPEEIRRLLDATSSPTRILAWIAPG